MKSYYSFHLVIITIMLIQQIPHPKRRVKHHEKKAQNAVVSMSTVKMDHQSFNFVKQPIFSYIKKSIDKKIKSNIKYTHFRSKSERSVLHVQGHPFAFNSLKTSKRTLGQNHNDNCSQEEEEGDIPLRIGEPFLNCKVGNRNSFGERGNQFYKRERGQFMGKQSKLLRWREQSFSQRFCSNLAINRLSFNLQKLNNQPALLHSKRLKTDSQKYIVEERIIETLSSSSNNDFEDSLLFRCKEAMKGLTIQSLRNQLNARNQGQSERQACVDRLLLSKEVVCLQLPNKSSIYKSRCPAKDNWNGCEDAEEVHQSQKMQVKMQATQREWLQPLKRRYRKYSSNCQQAIKSVKIMKQSGGNKV